jgi:hypothetical protein
MQRITPLRAIPSKMIAIGLLSLASSMLSANDSVELGGHAASCSAYFFSAANAKGVAAYEELYGAGEYTFNLAVSAIGNEQALQHFSSASKQINLLMQKRWTDFYKVDEHYESKCGALKEAHLKVQAEQAQQ